MMVLPYLHYLPGAIQPVTADESSAVIGRATLGAGCYLGALATLRANGNFIRVGAQCWFGEASTVHIVDELLPACIGDGVTVGRFALVHACSVSDGCVIGDGAVVMDGAEVGPESVIAAESLVPPGKKLPGGWLFAGAPAKAVEKVSAAFLQQFHLAVRRAKDGQGHGVPAAPDMAAVTAKIASLPHEPGFGIGAYRRGNTYLAPTARVSGRVSLAPNSSVWFGVAMDAAEASIEIGEGTNIQDNSRLYAGAPSRKPARPEPD